MWDEVLGHEQNKEFLARLLQPGSRPHALLFYGAGGIGKRLLALHFIKSFLCLGTGSRPCGCCESCRLFDIAAGSFAHPDFYMVEPEAAGKDIKIEQVKEMAKQAAFAPVLSAHKVCLIDDAGFMTAEAANSLLKLLEEPPRGWLFILITQQAERLLPTVLSRVVRLRFDTPRPEDAMRILQAQGVIDKADVLARLAGGSPGRALYFNEAGIFNLRAEALGLLRDLPLVMPFGYLAGQGWGEKYDKTQALLLTEQLTYLLRDLLLINAGAPKEIYNTDMAAALGALAGGWPLYKTRRAVDAAQEAWQNISNNVSAKNVLEALVLKLDLLRKE